MSIKIDVTTPFENTLEEDLQKYSAKEGIQEKIIYPKWGDTPAASREGFQKLVEKQQFKKSQAYFSNDPVRTIQEYYGTNHKFASDEIEKIFPTSLDLYGYLKSRGVTDENKAIGDQMDEYRRTQWDKMQKQYDVYKWYAQDVMDLDEENAKAMAKDMMGKLENDKIESGYRAWIPNHLEAIGDKKEADALRAMGKVKYSPINLLDRIERAKEKNLLVKIERDRETGEAVARTFDVDGKEVMDINKFTSNTKQFNGILSQFKSSIQNDMYSNGALSVLSDKDNSDFISLADARISQKIHDIGIANKISDDDVLNNLKFAYGKQSLTDRQMKDLMIQDFKAEATRVRDGLDKGSAAFYNEAKGILAQTAADILGTKVGKNVSNTVPVGDISRDKLKLQAARLKAESLKQNTDIDVVIAQEIVENSGIVSDENRVNLLNAAMEVLEKSGIVGEIKGQLAVIANEKADKQAEFENKVQFELAKIRQKEPITTRKTQLENGSLYVNAVQDDDMRYIIEQEKYKDDGKPDIGLFQKMGVNYDDENGIVTVTPKRVERNLFDIKSEIFKNETKVRDENKGEFIINKPDKGRVNPEAYLELFELYRNGVADSQAKLDEIGMVLQERENMRTFLKQYADSGVDYKTLKNVVFSPSKLKKVRKLVELSDYRNINSERTEFYKRIVPESDSSKENQDKGAFYAILETYPTVVQGYANSSAKDKDVNGLIESTFNENFDRLPPSIRGLFTPVLRKAFEDNASTEIKKLAMAVAIANKNIK